MNTEIKALLMAHINVTDVDESTMAQLEQHAARLEHSGYPTLTLTLTQTLTQTLP